MTVCRSSDPASDFNAWLRATRKSARINGYGSHNEKAPHRGGALTKNSIATAINP